MIVWVLVAVIFVLVLLFAIPSYITHTVTVGNDTLSVNKTCYTDHCECAYETKWGKIQYNC